MRLRGHTIFCRFVLLVAHDSNYFNIFQFKLTGCIFIFKRIFVQESKWRADGSNREIDDSFQSFVIEKECKCPNWRLKILIFSSHHYYTIFIPHHWDRYQDCRNIFHIHEDWFRFQEQSTAENRFLFLKIRFSIILLNFSKNNKGTVSISLKNGSSQIIRLWTFWDFHLSTLSFCPYIQLRDPKALCKE